MWPLSQNVTYSWHVTGGDKLSRHWVSGNMIAKQDPRFVNLQYREGVDCWHNWVAAATGVRVSQYCTVQWSCTVLCTVQEPVCHNQSLLCPGLREGARCPSSDLGINRIPEIRGLGYLFSPDSWCQPGQAKWCNFKLIFNGGVSLRFLKRKLLFHSHIAFTEDNYSASSALTSLIVSSEERD